MLLYYSTNPSLDTVCSRRQKVERIALEIEISHEFQAAKNEYYRNKSYTASAFKADVQNMVSCKLRLNKDNRAEKLNNLYKAVVNHILCNYVA